LASRPPYSTLFPYTTLFRSGRVRVLGRPAAALRLLEQRLVVLLRGLERIRAHDRLARIVAIAISPRGGRWRIVADQRVAVAAPRSEEHTSELQSRENLVCRL